MRRVVSGFALACLMLMMAVPAYGYSRKLNNFSAVSTTKVTASSSRVDLQVPPRYMWGWGDGLRGYCGSFSFQSFGLKFGNYISAESIRNAADGHELLIAVNDEIAANNLRFSYEEWNYEKETTPQGKGFMSWAANHLDQGHGVIGGFYEQIDGGDEDYDHIMPIVAYLRDDSAQAQESSLNKTTVRTDVLGIYYNDLYRPESLYGAMSSFVKSRSNCDAPNGIQPLAAPYQFCLPSEYSYGIALKGNRDDEGELFPTRVVPPSWTEPDYGYEDQIHAPVVNFTISLVIEGLTVGQKYTILRFNHAAMVPVSNFARGAYAKRWDVTATASTMELSNFDSFLSDATVFYRTIQKP